MIWTFSGIDKALHYVPVTVNGMNGRKILPRKLVYPCGSDEVYAEPARVHMNRLQHNQFTPGSHVKAFAEFQQRRLWGKNAGLLE